MSSSEDKKFGFGIWYSQTCNDILYTSSSVHEAVAVQFSFIGGDIVDISSLAAAIWTMLKTEGEEVPLINYTDREH